MKNLILFLFIFSFFSCSTPYKTLTARMPDLNAKLNGVYQGEYNLTSTPIKVTLDVYIQNNKIMDIKIVKHTSSPIGKKAEKIINIIISSQSLEVDAVSGATASSKSILKAVENALE